MFFIGWFSPQRKAWSCTGNLKRKKTMRIPSAPRKESIVVTIESMANLCTPVNYSKNSWLDNGPFEDIFPVEHGDIRLLC